MKGLQALFWGRDEFNLPQRVKKKKKEDKSQVQTLMYAAATKDHFIIIDGCVGKRTDAVSFSEVSKHCVKVQNVPRAHSHTTSSKSSADSNFKLDCHRVLLYRNPMCRGAKKQKGGVCQPPEHNCSSHLEKLPFSHIPTHSLHFHQRVFHSCTFFCT